MPVTIIRAEAWKLCSVLGMGQRCILVAAVVGRKNPQGIDPKRGAEREVDERENRKDDRENAAPRLTRKQSVSRQNSASDTNHDGEECNGPETVQPHTAKRAPAKVEVVIA